MLIVVLFHADVPGFAGGFVGVDVFFVISGYLITRNIIREIEHQGSLDLATFWLGRAKRLLPAATAMIAIVVLAQLAVRNPLFWSASIREGLAATFYVSNEFFARSPSGYFDAAPVERALLHTWSLSVEEQFYLAWPLLLSAAAGGAAFRNRTGVKRTWLLIGAVGIASFLLSAQLTRTGSDAAYLSSLSRAWEFLVGAALARANFRQPRRSVPAAVLGLGMIVGASALLIGGTDFPVPLAFLPVIGAALIIVAAVDPDSGVGRLFGAAPVQYLGRLSYSWYLWHWPILVLGQEIIGSSPLMARVGLAVGAFLPAAASHHLIEQPMRHWNPGSRIRLLAFGFAAPTMLAVAAVGVLAVTNAATFREPAALALRDARDDWPTHIPTCAVPDVAQLEQICVFGDPDAEASILLVGDSHASHWLAPLDVVGQSLGVRVIALNQGNCPGAILRAESDLAPACARLGTGMDHVIDHFAVSAVITSHSISYASDDLDAWEAGHRRLASDLARRNVALLVLHDIPTFAADPLLCLMNEGPSEPGADARCGLSRQAADDQTGPVRDAEQRGIATIETAVGFNPLTMLCDDLACQPRIDDQVAFVDNGHLAVSFATTLAPRLEPLVLEVLMLSQPTP